MATRSRTLLFLQYRNSFARVGGPRQPRPPGIDTSERAGLIANDINQNAETVVEMSVLPPKWVDIVDEVSSAFAYLPGHLTELEGIHKKHLLPGFDDHLAEEQVIERLTDSITSMFRDCERKIKRVHSETRSASGTKQSQILSKNIQVSLATKLQDLSNIFRKSQSSYLNKLRGRETRSKDMFALEGGQVESPEDEALDAVFTDAQLQLVQNNERAITEREKEINEIVKSLLGVADIFKELQTMVIDQGTVLDRIDYNIEQTNVHMEEAHKELVQGSKYQSKAMGKYCIILLCVFVFLCLLVLIFKKK
ncbi:t-SNARE [Blyttiomyces helicus]|uniref:t-SNARE n=1 Tax=Blyttiomyces helicus TaxID=388810 RepID=A0A4P9W967_9FUNG|nr:t-SNARE [Blyttiomyces helicus]|eukprot:RKO89089.1 t-SNARE [Blyttiomyces helicus]